ncbi:CheW protein [Thermodesulfatator indicus DSM 15286]|uniref:CheW protein n=1 Tax=Thermodesulfatator indicus (strain DSM 15286 / JCM 11887 / CIR29812) TaxID=667014 RepID=F8AA92_THEID|nr:chemotaxis protein CheW [Thermodesulfatator indicus]AEH44228.1 CheW protein [Thermodesulfatator indicus DSM 15286]
MSLPTPEKQEKSIVSEKTKLFITFWLADFLFALPVEEVVEINRSLDITPVPQAPNYVSGIINLRGQILTAIDLAQRIGLKREREANHNVIVGREEEPLSLLVEQIGDVLEIPISQIEEPPEVIEGIDTDFVKNVSKLPDRLLVILDSEKLFKV